MLVESKQFFSPFKLIMLIRCSVVYLATIVVVVVTLKAISCEPDNAHAVINADNVDVFCPCLSQKICPRVFGTKPEDAKYLGELMKCEDDDLVRCCGASESYVVGILKIISTTQVPEPDIFSRLNAEDDLENEIPDLGREYGKFTTEPSVDDISTEIADSQKNLIDEKLMLVDGQIDEEPVESKSITETSRTEAPTNRDFQSLKSIEIADSVDVINYDETESGETESITETITDAPSSHELKSFDGSEITETSVTEVTEVTEVPINLDYKSIEGSDVTEQFNSLDSGEITEISTTEAPSIHLNITEITATTEEEASIKYDFKSLDDAVDGTEATKIVSVVLTTESELEDQTTSPQKHPDGNEATTIEPEVFTTESQLEDQTTSPRKLTNGNEANEQEVGNEATTIEPEVSNETTTIEPEVFTTESQTEDQTISHRKPKMLNNVIMIYPNEMSGIPKTTPKNMPETNELKMFDEQMGMNLHLVFSKEKSEPIIELETTTVAVNSNIELETTTVAEKSNIKLEATTVPDNDSTTKQLLFELENRKRRRQYRPMRKRTTKSPTQATQIKSTTSSSSTTPKKLNNRLKSFHKHRLSSQESTDLKIRMKSSTTRKTTKTPIMPELEILETSEDDITHLSRFKLFNSQNRLNYLRRVSATTTATTTTTTTTTTELPIETTHHVSHSVKHKGKRKALQMSEKLIHQIDTSHRTMITKVRDGLMAASTTKQITEIPRSFGSVIMDKRVRKVETMLASKMTNAYNVIKSVVPHINDEGNTTKQPIEKSTSNADRPYRGKIKFDLSDPRQYGEIVNKEQRKPSIRSTTVRPININEHTTRIRRRRPTVTMPPTTTEQIFENKRTPIESTVPKDNRGKHFRRRVKIKRRILSVESVTTVLPPVLTTTSTVTTTSKTKSLIATNQKSTESTHAETDIRNTVKIDTERTSSDAVALSSNTPSKFKPSPLWSIQTDEPNGVTEFEDGKSSRQYRNVFQPPTQYINGFIPVSSKDRALPIIGPIPKPNIFAYDSGVRYSLPIDVEVTNFS